MHSVPVDIEQLKKIATFVGAARELIDKQAALEGVVAEKAPAVIATLVSQGLVSPHLKEAKIQDLIADPMSALDMVVKAAEQVQVPALGAGDSEEKTASAEPTADEAFEQRILG